MSNLTFDTKLKKALMKNKATIGFVDYQAQINQIKQLISETITDAEGLVESEREELRHAFNLKDNQRL